MSGIHVVASSLFAIAALSASSFSHATNADDILRADLERVSQRRIFFGHQSVGANLLDGINQLALTAGVPVHIVEVKSANSVETATFGHSFVAENGNPLRKLQSFEQAMGQQPSKIDIALVKFCFVDFTPETDVKALFSKYSRTIDGLRASNPRTVFVHVTAPLTTVRTGLKTRLQQMLGKTPYGIIENMRREEYNSLLRQAYHGHEPIFDLARIESTDPKGASVVYEWKGNVVPMMDSAYTEDGGHLNAFGKLRAARELISVLASIPDRTAGERIR